MTGESALRSAGFFVFKELHQLLIIIVLWTNFRAVLFDRTSGA